MFTYRTLLLTVTISFAGIALADILVQPGYEHQYRANSRYPQYPVPQHQAGPPAAEQYRAQQLTQPLLDQQQYLMGVQTVYPYYGIGQNQARSQIVGYPFLHRNYRFLPTRHLHLAKLGGLGYVRPSMLIGQQPVPSTVQRRYRRSTSETDSTPAASGEPQVAANDDDVAPKPTLIQSEYPTAVDSHLPQNEPTDTDDKHVENRQSKNTITGPFLLGLYPEKMYSEQSQIENEIKYPLPKSVPVEPSKDQHKQSIESLVEPSESEPTRIPTSVIQGSHINDDCTNYTPQLPRHNEGPSMTPEDSQEISNRTAVLPSQVSELSSQTPVHDGHQANMYRGAFASSIISPMLTVPSQIGPWNSPNLYHSVYEAAQRNFPDPRPVYSPYWLKPEPMPQQNFHQVSQPTRPSQRHNKGNDDSIGRMIIGALNSGKVDESFRILYPYNYQTYEMPSFPMSDVDYDFPDEEYDYPYPNGLDYATYENSDTRGNVPSITINTIPTSPSVPQTPQFSNTYNYPTQMAYLAPTQAYKYYYVTPTSNYKGIPFYGTSSFPAYY